LFRIFYGLLFFCIVLLLGAPLNPWIGAHWPSCLTQSPSRFN
jgi:hypothetical protein